MSGMKITTVISKKKQRTKNNVFILQQISEKKYYGKHSQNIEKVKNKTSLE
jgi:hypothetical protein